MKKILSLLILLLWGLSALPATTGPALAASWAEPYLNNLVDRAVMKGDPDGQLYPNRSVTRAEFAAMLNRAFGFSEQGGAKFRDVAATAWYAADISIAANQGYLQGDSKGANPVGSLTREEAAAMLCRALKIAPLSGEQFRLTDERGFSNWSRGYINAAADKGFVSGYPDGSFQPKNRITRGEAAKMLSEVAGEIRSSSVQQRLGRTISGNLTISSSSVTLSDTTVTGDLYITEGVGLGYVQLENVTVLGEVIISGAGESNVGASSIILTDCEIPRLTVDVAKRKILTLKTDGTTRVREAIIKSSTYLEELSRHYEGFDKVVLDAPAKSFLNLRGSFGEVLLLGEGSVLGLYQGQISSITVDEAALKSTISLEKDTYVSSIYFDAGATVSGLGEIESVLVNNDGTVIAQLPENIYIRPGVTATIGGKKMGFLDAEMDGLAPAFSGDYPKVDLLTPTGFTLLYMSNKPGKVYYGVYPADTPRPSLEELMAKSGTSKTALKQGVLNTLPEKEVKTAISGLKAGTQYVVYSVFVDLRGEDSGILRDNVITVDNVIPALLSGYPKVENISKDKASFVLIPNKATSFYWAILPDKATAPTSEQLYKQNVSGAVLQSVTHNGRPNERTDITLSDLKESVTYTFYVVLGDSAGNLSKTPAKLSFTTKDMTAPKFITPDYPRIGVPAATAIPLEYMVDEPCTIYWMAAREGTNILPDNPEKKSEAVKLGTGAYKNGKATAAKENTKYTLSLSGLEKEMSYDIYLVLEDKAGNISGVTSLNSKTLDKTAPTATVTTPQPINGKFPIDRPISIEFSEIVCVGNGSSEPQRLSEFFNKATDKKVLANYIQLLDLTDTSQTSPPQLSVNWNRVTIQDYNARTTITFLGTEYDENTGKAIPEKGSALTLSNDNRYQFTLGYKYPQGYILQDTSRNEMKEKTALTFQTVPSLTYFNEVKQFDPTKFDAAFLLRPDQQNTGEYVFFDILMRSDQRVEFDLYQADTLADLNAAKTAKQVILPENYATLFLDSGSTGMPKYNALKSTYYGIKITKVGDTVIGDTGSPITTAINLKMNGIIGNVSYLRDLRGPADTLEARIKAAGNRGDISEVTAPSTPFSLRIGLVDSQPPVATDYKFLEGDTAAVMQLKTDKACTVYYLALPTSKATPTIPPGSTPPYTASEILGGASNSDTVRGSFQASGGSIATEASILNLTPETKYNIYFFLKGAAPDNSKVYEGTFETKDIEPPENTMLYYTARTGGVDVFSKWKSANCKVFYVLYQQGATSATPEPEQIKNPPEGMKAIARGDFNFDWKDGNEQPYKLQLNGLKESARYTLYMVAQRRLGGGSLTTGPYSEICVLDYITPLDQTRPGIVGEPRGTAEHQGNGKFKGQVGITFTEPLYYFDTGTAAKPLDITTFMLNMRTIGSGNIWSGGAGDYQHEIVPILGPNGKPTGTTEECLSFIRFNYENITDGMTIEFTKTIGDRAVNLSGTLSLTFHVTQPPTDAPAGTNPTGYWTYQFSIK